MSPSEEANVTLGIHKPAPNRFADKLFPCPLCGLGMEIRIARTGKPYCHCDICAIQLFFRGREGIRRLHKILESGGLISGANLKAIVLYNRIQKLKADKRELEKKQGILFRNRDLENAITVVQAEIESVQLQLEKISAPNRGRRKK